MNLKEMKELATEKGIEFKKNAGLKKMEELLALHEEDAAPVVTERRELGINPVTGESVYL